MGFFTWAVLLLLFGTVAFTFTFRKAPKATVIIFILLWLSPILSVLITGWLVYTILSLAPSLLSTLLRFLLSKAKRLRYAKSNS